MESLLTKHATTKSVAKQKGKKQVFDSAAQVRINWFH